METLMEGAARGAPNPLRYKIFLSVDIVGSTAFKQPFDASNSEALEASARRANDWQRAIASFYKTVNLEFLSRWSSLKAKTTTENPEIDPLLFGDRPRFWKTIGDEILFWKQIDHELQLLALIDSWLGAIAAIRRKFLSKPATKGLDVKATIWSAEFPLRNKLIVAGDDDSTDAAASAVALEVAEETPQSVSDAFYAGTKDATGIVDFIGPGIDVGFRLSSLSSTKKMAVSLDVAFLLSNLGVWSEKEAKVRDRQIHVPDPRNSNAEYIIYIDELLENNRRFIHDFIKEKLGIDESFSANNDRIENIIDFLKVHFSGRNPLKGTLGGIKYPFLWINTMCSTSLDDYTEKLYIEDDGRTPLKWEQLFLYCQKFYDDRQKFLCPPVVSLNGMRTFSYNPDRVREYRDHFESEAVG